MKRKPATPESDDSPRPTTFTAGWLTSQSPDSPIPPLPLPTADSPSWPDAATPATEDHRQTVAPGWSGARQPEAAEGEFALPERFDVSRPLGDRNPDAIIASALLDAPQEEGLRYLLNYANKSIRKNRGVPEQDRDDLLHDIYMEWWLCVGFEVTALPRLLEAESPERQSLRESIYRVFGRYRYHQSAHRTQDLVEGDCLDPGTLVPADGRDFTLDLETWLKRLPDLEAKIIDLYYFQHKTMEEIGAEIGLAKQRVSEIHKRALARHPGDEST